MRHVHFLDQSVDQEQFMGCEIESGFISGVVYELHRLFYVAELTEG